MGKKKDKYPTFRTPPGRLVYPFLNTARDYEGDEKFAYMTTLILKGKEAAKLEKFIDNLVAETKQRFKTRKVAHRPYDEVVDEDGVIVRGETAFKFKVAAITETKTGKEWDRRPALFFPNGHPCEKILATGTIASIAYQTYCWKSPNGIGVMLQPTALMIDELVEYTGRDAKSYGWDVKDDGAPDPDDHGGPEGGVDGGDF